MYYELLCMTGHYNLFYYIRMYVRMCVGQPRVVDAPEKLAESISDDTAAPTSVLCGLPSVLHYILIVRVVDRTARGRVDQNDREQR